MSIKRIGFKVHGTVQGVNFRSFTAKKARSYGLTGRVENTSDGKVDGEAQGTEDSLKQLLKDIDKGPPAAKVVKLEKWDLDVKEGESGFTVS